jgi:hypothetical protein
MAQNTASRVAEGPGYANGRRPAGAREHAPDDKRPIQPVIHLHLLARHQNPNRHA